MSSLIVKLGATGDVVRTTTLLHRLPGPVTWVTARPNETLLTGLAGDFSRLRVVLWDDRFSLSGETFDLILNLEDDRETSGILELVRSRRLFGAYANKQGTMTYTDDAREWFEMSLISEHGRTKADTLKFQNRRSYQEIIFEALGWTFGGERYLLPTTPRSVLQGDIAIAPEAGPVWPMKKWAYYDRLKTELEKRGLRVHVLPRRPTLLDHLADVRGHLCLVSGDSLPMHLALGSDIPCVGLFNCTSPWEIHDYGILTKLVSSSLGEFFYRREFDARATTSIPFEDVLNATITALEHSRSTT
jgi:ADP-heptose:LPS heptosyltransferase